MNLIKLTGFRADLPMGVMAAFGLLRLVTAAEHSDEVYLSWNGKNGNYHPVLHANVTRERLLSLLARIVQTAPVSKALTWTEQIKSTDAEKLSGIMREFASVGIQDRASLDWIAAVTNEITTDEGRARSTPFDMSVARQRFPADAVKLTLSLAANEQVASELEEAVFGPWRYGDDQHSFGWDPSTVKLGAFTYKAPTAMANKGVRAAVWLAFQSLPLFPVFAQDRKQRTRAFDQRGQGATFYWPVWTPEITLTELQSLLASRALIDEKKRRELMLRGVVALYRSERVKPNKYMATFAPAELVYAVPA